MKKMKKLKVGVIGTGHMGCNHVRIYAEEIGYFELIGVYDNDYVLAQKVAEQYNTKAFRTMDELLDNTEAVSIAVPSSLHCSIGKIVAERGVHALVEKPLALNSRDACELSEEFSKRQLVLQVGHIERFNPVIVELEKIIDSKQIFYIEIHRYGPFSGNGRITDASVVEDLMIHDIDLACHIFKPLKVTRINAYGERIRSNSIDFATAVLEFEGVAHAVISSSRVSQGKERTIEIHCENCLIEADLLAKSLTITKDTDLKVEGIDTSNVKQDGIVQKIYVPIKEPLKQELLSFYEAVVNLGEIKVPGEMGIESVRLCEKILSCIES